MTMPDRPATESDIKALVRRFYDIALADSLLGPMFRETIPDLESHLPVVENFWSHALLGTNRYSGSAYALLETFKNHPSIKPLLAGSECKEYAAHLIPEGGYNAIPQLVGAGWIVVGDAGQFVNAVHREGSNLAMTTGRIAAETVVWLHRRREAMSHENLLEYERRLAQTFVMKDLKKYKGIPDLLHNNKQTFFGLYPKLISQAMQTWFRVDGIDKKSKEKEIFQSFRSGRTLFGMMGDAFRLVRAWR